MLNKMKVGFAAVLLSASMGVSASGSIFDLFESLTDWSDWGQGIDNNHHNLYAGISKRDLNDLVALCAIDYRANPTDANNVTTSKPLIVDDTVYWSAQTGQIGAHKVVRDANGNFVECKKLWQQSVSSVVNIGVNGLTSRTSPAFYKRADGKGTLLFLTPANYFDYLFTSPPGTINTIQPIAYALDAATGVLLWKVPVAPSAQDDPSSFAPTTTSAPRVYKGYAYFGLASFNNLRGLGIDINTNQTFRGQLKRLDLKLGGGTPSFPADVKTLYTIPAKPASYTGTRWFAGAGVWASTPSIIPYGGKNNKGLVIFGSGQLYDYPDFVGDCMSETVAPVTIEGKTFTKRGETGGGAKVCYDRAVQELINLGVDVANHPLANNSAIAVNLVDFTHAWHVPTAGIDAWQIPCGLNLEFPNAPGCTVVPGPDYDVGGNSPVIVKSLFSTYVISHNKSGQLFWINPFNGQVFKRVDVCVGSPAGGIQWGFAYDPIRRTLMAPCTGSDLSNNINYNVTLANGETLCRTTVLNAIDVNTGALKWQAIGHRGFSSTSPECPVGKDVNDERFKYGLSFDVVIKNQVFPNVPFNEMPTYPNAPVQEAGSRNDGVPSTSQGILYWPMHTGIVFALDVNNGQMLNSYFCNQGGIDKATPSVADGLLVFGCGRRSIIGLDPVPARGNSFMVYGKQQDKFR